MAAHLKYIPPDCSFCRAHAQNERALLTCGKCKRAYYCNKECQKKHWNIHKVDCYGDENPEKVERIFNEGQRDEGAYRAYQQIMNMRKSKLVYVVKSKIPGAGRGCFAKRGYHRNEIIPTGDMDGSSPDNTCLSFINDGANIEKLGYNIFGSEATCPLKELEVVWKEYLLDSRQSANVIQLENGKIEILRELKMHDELLRCYGAAFMITCAELLEECLMEMKYRIMKERKHVLPLTEYVWEQHFANTTLFIFDNKTYHILGYVLVMAGKNLYQWTECHPRYDGGTTYFVLSNEKLNEARHRLAAIMGFYYEDDSEKNHPDMVWRNHYKLLVSHYRKIQKMLQKDNEHKFDIIAFADEFK